MEGRGSRIIALAIGLTIAASCVLSVLIGWGFDAGSFVRLAEGHPAMMPSTALCFILLAFSAAAGALRHAAAPKIAAALGGAVAATGVLSICARLAGVAGGIDSLLPFGYQPGDAMSYATACGMILAGGNAWWMARGGAVSTATNTAVLGLSFYGGLLIAGVFLPGQQIAHPFFSGLSAYTVVLFCLVFARQLMQPLVTEASEQG